MRKLKHTVAKTDSKGNITVSDVVTNGFEAPLREIVAGVFPDDGTRTEILNVTSAD